MRIQFGELDIRVSKESPTTFDVVVGNSRTGLGVLMCSVEQEKPPYEFYKVVNLQIYPEEKSAIDLPNKWLQLSNCNPEKSETDNC